MTSPSLSIVAQYVRHLEARAHVRPYANKSPLSNAIGGGLNIEALPEAGHWRLELEVRVSGRNAEGVLCFECGCAMEAIVVTAGMDEPELRAYLSTNIAGLLFGNIRAQLASASAMTGYGPVTLPPITSDRIAGMLKSSEAPSAEQ